MNLAMDASPLLNVGGANKVSIVTLRALSQLAVEATSYPSP
ncbi:MAG: hypothetical protein ACXAEX_23215 [Promethearchaeota archaeon]